MSHPLISPGDAAKRPQAPAQPRASCRQRPSISALFGPSQAETFEDRFLWIMKNLPTFVEKPELWDDPYFNEFMEQAEFASMSFEEQEAYIASMKQKWDYDNSIEFAEQKGEKKTAEKIARLMLADKEPLDKIVKYSGLTKEQIQAL